MMLLILYVFMVDTILPLPDLSKVIFPEPQLWIAPERNYMAFQGYGIDYYGGMMDLKLDLFDLHADYRHDYTWDTTDLASLHLSQYIMASSFWIRPLFQGMYYDRNRTYLNVHGSCEVSYYFPWSIISSLFESDNWFINNVRYRQTDAQLSITFDRLKFPYYLGLHGRFSDEIQMFGFTTIKIGGFLIGLNSPLLKNFPSPRLRISYIEPGLQIAQSIESGIFQQNFDSYLDMDSPKNYSYPAPDESLHVRLITSCQFDILGQSLILKNTYAYWQFYPTQDRHFRHSSLPETQTNDLVVRFNNSIRYNRLHIRNHLAAGYFWSDSTIIYRPRYSIEDTITITISHFFTDIMLHYFSRRPGLENELSPWFTASTRIGFRIKFSEIFLIIKNIDDFQGEVYDGFFFAPRYYTAGAKFMFNL